MEYYSAIMKNEIKWFVGKWMEVETIMISEIIQIQTSITFFLSSMESRKKYMKVEGD
jgi:hypothetical protein